mgnify:CR=1 FL=1
MYENLDGEKRTLYCGQFSEKDLNKEVVAFGWVAKRRDFGGLVFIDLRDRSGIVQVVFNEAQFKGDYKKVDMLRNEYVLCVKGKVILRDEDTINPKLENGTIEIRATELKILASSNPVPFLVEEDLKVNDMVKLKYRYLDLRRKKMQDILLLRSKVCKIVRNYLDDLGFIEVETPALGKSTPEGARDYLVPSRTFPNKFFALPQSPQLYKQLLMISGVDKYYQIAKCFRDEDLRADRQPEFTQIDMEMSFVDQEEQVMSLVETMIKDIFKQTINYSLPEKFLRMPYTEAMDRFGSDKPDMRFGLELVNISDIAEKCTLEPFKNSVLNGGSVRILNAKDKASVLSRTDLEKLVTFVKGCGAPGMSYITTTKEGPKGPLIKFFTPSQLEEIFKRCDAGDNDVIFFIADKNNELVQTSLGKLRLHLGEMFNLIDPNDYKVLWVTDFPQFEYSEEEKRFVAKHHPFTCPKSEDVQYLFTNPEKVRAKAYDIVVNGYELGGGSIRIHDQELQEKMFEALGFTQERIENLFGFFVNAFKYGAPPHGGLAIGLDRLIMLLAKTTDIKEVIAFPKIQTAMDVMTEAPDVVTDKQLEDIYISLVKPEKEN